MGVEALRRLRRTLGADRRRHDPRQGGYPPSAIEAKLGSLALFEVIEAEPESVKAANESRGEEREHDTTLATIWVTMKEDDARTLEDQKAYHLAFDIDSRSVAV